MQCELIKITLNTSSGWERQKPKEGPHLIVLGWETIGRNSIPMEMMNDILQEGKLPW